MSVIWSMVSSTLGDWFRSLFSQRSIIWIMNVSYSLSILRQSVSRRENSLWNVLPIVIYLLVIFFLIGAALSLIAKNCVIIVKSSACSFRKINACFRVCLGYLWLASIWIDIPIGVIDDSLNSWISFLCVDITHSFPFACKVVRGL